MFSIVLRGSAATSYYYNAEKIKKWSANLLNKISFLQLDVNKRQLITIAEHPMNKGLQQMLKNEIANPDIRKRADFF